MKRHKKDKELKRRYGKLAASMEPYYHHLDLRPISELDDDAFAYIMEKVRGVNMLDLNETEITNESIRLLTRLEYVIELRAKGCQQINNECIGDLNQLATLEFLHLKDTAVTLAGLLHLDKLSGLRELHFSEEGVEDLGQLMRQLRKVLPGCAFVVNSVPYQLEEDRNKWG